MVEYLIIGLVLIIVIAVLGLLVQALEDGVFVGYAAQNASHAVTGNTAGAAGDVLLY
jgi:L-asparagine transporter-like permease